ncbi:hypothetical protein AMJ82_06585, partial [candidate division TA06 bacterium SM23_40]
MWSAVANRLLLNSLKIVYRRPVIPLTGLLRNPNGIIVRSPSGPGQYLFSMPALWALVKLHPSTPLVLILSGEGQDLPCPLPAHCEVVRIDFSRLRASGRLHRRSRRVLGQYGADLFVDFEGAGEPAMMAAWAANTPVRATFRCPGLTPFFNCEVVVDLPRCRDDIDRYLRLVAALGAEAEDRSLDLDLGADELARARDFLRLVGLRKDEVLVGLDIGPPADGSDLDMELLMKLIVALERRVSNVRFLVTHSTGRPLLPKMRHLLAREPLVVVEPGLRHQSALVAQCALLIARQTDLFSVACALGVPALLLRG